MFGVSGMPISSFKNFDPSFSPLTGWWRGSFVSSPWGGSSSVGSGSGNSAGRNLTTGSFNPPNAVGNVNGYTPANFNGSGLMSLVSSLNSDNYFNSNAMSSWILFNAGSLVGDNGAGSRFNNTQFWTDTLHSICMGVSSAGLHACVYGGSGTELIVSFSSINSWHLAQFKFDGSTIKLRVDNGAWSSLASTSSPAMTGTMVFGSRFDQGGSFITAQMLDIGFSDTVFSDTTFDNIRSYVNARYNLSL